MAVQLDDLEKISYFIANRPGCQTARGVAGVSTFQAELEREAALGFGQAELAFYDTLANNKSAVRELGADILKMIAHEYPATISTTGDRGQ